MGANRFAGLRLEDLQGGKSILLSEIKEMSD
jgi:hypothetical protein